MITILFKSYIALRHERDNKRERGERQTDRERQRQRDRERETERQRKRDRQRERGRESRGNTNIGLSPFITYNYQINYKIYIIPL